ncbi:hypothetical protein Zmor_024229 [Zophobas morio]|uniref:Uncharacterized protein n=1 Tax=Zophobas morio TaxID=2755281 RepID=A0AA38HZX5_9CUCU|nr:hypothetical protein Zmor_024229 [Zophobas morio]
MTNFSNLQRLGTVILYADGNTRLARELCRNIHITGIVAVIEPKEYNELKNKFWNASEKCPTSALADLQLKLEFHSL